MPGYSYLSVPPYLHTVPKIALRSTPFRMDLGGVDLSRSAVGQGAGRAKAKGIGVDFLGPTWLCAGVGGFAEGVTCLDLSCGAFAFVGWGVWRAVNRC